MSSGEIDNLVRADFAAATSYMRAKCGAKGELRKLPIDLWKAEAVKLIIIEAPEVSATSAQGNEGAKASISCGVVLAAVDAKWNLGHHAFADLLDIIDEWELHIFGGDQPSLALQIAQQALAQPDY
jgi:hypothetical protein